MLRRTVLRLFPSSARALTTTSALLEEGGAPAAGTKEFAEIWSKKAPPNLGLPEVSSDFLTKYPEGESAADGEKFPVNFYCPHGVISEGKLDQVVLPGVDGYFGVKANHVPYIAQLKPGMVELHDGTDVTKYFVSGGFAFVHPNSVTDICVVEAATLDQFDAVAVKQALASAAQEKGGEGDFEQAMGRVAAEFYQALDAAIEGKA